MAIDSVSSYSPTMATLQQSLTSGSRINQAADNPSGLAMVTSFNTQINQQDYGVRNANSGISMLQTADGVSESIGTQLQRLNELATQAQNGTYSAAQRNNLDAEFQQGLKSINQFVGQASFNGTNLLDGSTQNMEIALGSSTSNIALPNFSTSGLALDGLSISSSAGANGALTSLTAALETYSTGRAQFGAQQNGLSSAIENLSSQNTNAQATRSQINDTDYAKSIVEMSRQQILEQSGLAMQSQRNQDKSQVLQLLL